MTKKTAEQLEAIQLEAIKNLRDFGVKPGTTIYTHLETVSRSGMSRRISVFIVAKSRYSKPKGKPYIQGISQLVAQAIGNTYDRNYQAVKIDGCGMDMGFAIVYNLGLAMWPKGTSKPHGTRNGEPDSDGGYALKQEWL